MAEQEEAGCDAASAGESVSACGAASAGESVSGCDAASAGESVSGCDAASAGGTSEHRAGICSTFPSGAKTIAEQGESVSGSSGALQARRSPKPRRRTAWGPTASALMIPPAFSAKGSWLRPRRPFPRAPYELEPAPPTQACARLRQANGFAASSNIDSLDRSWFFSSPSRWGCSKIRPSAPARNSSSVPSSVQRTPPIA